MQIFTISETEYHELLKRLDDINENISVIIKYPNDKIYDNADLLRLLKVSRRTLQAWRTNGLISFSQVGTKIYYTQKDINEFMHRHYKKRFA